MNIPNMTLNFYRKIGLASLAGLLSILIFPKFNIELFAWIVFIPLFSAIQSESIKNAFWLGWIAGVIHFLGTLYWVTVTMVLYGSLSEFLSVLVLILMAVYLALYMGTFCMLIRFLQDRTVLPVIVTAPVLWVGLEYLRSFFFLGFPWNSLGYSQFLTPYVTQIADITGVYGVSFLIVLVNACIYTVLFTTTPRIMKIQTVVATLCCVGFCAGYSLFILSSADGSTTTTTPSETSSNTLRVAVVQGNIDQGIKWEREHRQQIFNIHARLSEDTLDKQPDMIVWPETAVPFAFQYDQANKQKLIDLVQNLNTYLLFGGMDLIPAPLPQRYHALNSAFLLSPKGETLAKYDKIHLVPFGEYVPFQKILFFVEKITKAIGRVRPGKTYQIMHLDQTPFSTVICFEIIFPNLVRKFVDRGARFLVTITNDAWFARTAASYQHFAMVTFRAIENRVAIARSANTGISGFIDPYGRIIEQSDIFVEDVLVQNIPIRSTTTFYTRYGDVFARLCFVLSLLWVGYVFLKNKRRMLGLGTGSQK